MERRCDGYHKKVLKPVEISGRKSAARLYNGFPVPIMVKSFAKINLGLCIGPLRADGFHELRTVYQTIALHDVIHVSVGRGSGIEILCEDPRVPRDESNTCYRIVEGAMSALKARGRVVIEIEKRLPVQGGLGGASGNAVAALLALERALKKQLPGAERLRIAAEVGSDLPLFLVGGTVLGVGRGEEVYPLVDLPAVACVVATPEVGISTPKAFADWDRLCGAGALAREAELRSGGPGQRPGPTQPLPPHMSKLTPSSPSDRMTELGRRVSSWLSSQRDRTAGRGLSGVSAKLGRGRAGNPLLDLVRTGIENDFERVVFPQYPELREVKRVFERAGAFYASLSGSGSAIYGLFASRTAAERAVARLRKAGIPAVATHTLTRRQYWKQLLAVGR
jgi:4-diphosphocytidyl-2-C-methyl-D-erythritol kinase